MHRQLIVVEATYWNRDCKFSWWCGTSKLKNFILNILGALEINSHNVNDLIKLNMIGYLEEGRACIPVGHET